MGETRERAYDLATADCYRCAAVTGEEMHLWYETRDGHIWTWLQESILPAVAFTPDEARAMRDGWQRLHDLTQRGVQNHPEFFIQPHTPDTGHRSTLAFGLHNGNMTYWRDGENRLRIELDPHTFQGLIDAWTEVCQRLKA